jgi:prevent-host-death family protein
MPETKTKAVAARAVTMIKRDATRIIAQLQKERTHIVITEHGRAAAVLLDVATYEELTRRLALLEGIARGERAFGEGRVVSHAAAKKRLSRWLAPQR